MSFISYGLNLEDLILYRALKNIDNGFYIDVGAWHPVFESITKAFYDRGWRGINIEPINEYFQLLQQGRPRDINLNVAAFSYGGEVVFHEILEVSSLSTVYKKYANYLTEEGYKIKEYTVPCITLDAICDKYQINTVHFLKIDVEGAEKAVLEGFTFTRVRPWVVVVEASVPNSTHDISQKWEEIILGKGYELVYRDGINRFYLAIEHSHLRARFSLPPNFFDDYISHQQWLVQQKLIKEREQKESLVVQLQLLETSLQDKEFQMQQMRQSLVMRSASCYHELIKRILCLGSWCRQYCKLVFRGTMIIAKKAGTFLLEKLKF